MATVLPLPADVTSLAYIKQSLDIQTEICSHQAISTLLSSVVAGLTTGEAESLVKVFCLTRPPLAELAATTSETQKELKCTLSSWCLSKSMGP